jgi:hypothetical protein
MGELGCDFDTAEGHNIIRGRCPVHGGTHSNFVLWTYGDDVPINWKCYSHHCHREYKTSLLGLVRGILAFQKCKKVGMSEAKAFLDKFVVGLPDAGPVESVRRTTRVRPWLPVWINREKVRQRLVIPSPYFVARGFSPEILARYDVGHSAKLGRSVIPLYDEGAAMCIGYASRYEGPACPRCGLCHRKSVGCGLRDERWRINDGFRKSDYLYNYAWARRSCGPLLLVESAASVWRLSEVGARSMACLGSDLTRSQVTWLADMKKEILVAFDNDDAGRDGARRAVEALSGRGVVARAITIPAQFNDLGDMPAGAVAEWLQEAVGTERASAWSLMLPWLDGFKDGQWRRFIAN